MTNQKYKRPNVRHCDKFHELFYNINKVARQQYGLKLI